MTDNARQAGLTDSTVAEVMADCEAFESAMVEAGFSRPDLGRHPGMYRYQRDQDRFAGWKLARAAQSADASNAATGQGLTENDIIEAIQQMWSAFDWHKGTWTVKREEVVEFARGLLREPRFQPNISIADVLEVRDRLAAPAAPAPTECECGRTDGKHERACPVYKSRRKESIAESKRFYDSLAVVSNACKSKIDCGIAETCLYAAPAPAAQADGDKRLLDLLTTAFGAHHPAIDDLASLILRANAKHQSGEAGATVKDSLTVGEAGVDARDAALEEAARLIETTRETTTIEGGGGETQRHLTPRKTHDLTGMTWAAGIRALKSRAAMADQARKGGE